MSAAIQPIPTMYGSTIFAQHARLLRDSAIDPDIARGRQYVSVDTKTRLAGPGFQPYQRRVPGLLIPVWNVHGEKATHQYRPDFPRLKRGSDKPVKYENAAGARSVVDVHPCIRDRVCGTSEPLWITEGIRKADSGISQGLACVGLLGVESWRVSDWASIPLKGREVFIVFDSDSATNVGVAHALRSLKSWLENQDARVRLIYLPPKVST